jgi:DNA-binding NtrC family response regulator
MYKLWIVEDETGLSQGLKIAFEKNGYAVSLAPSLGELKELLASGTPEIVLLDIRLPDGNGLCAIPHILKASSGAKVIVMTAFGDSSLIVQAIKEGAYNYLDKPFPLEAARNMVERAAENITLQRTVSRLNENRTIDLVGSSPAIDQIRAFVKKVTDVPDLNILLRGESGSGKEVVARMIHSSAKSKGDFVPLNCAAIPENLLEAELFGYRKGAYTGAGQDKTGLIEMANGGTLFLDEIGDMPLSLQGKLLRFLDSRSYRPLGGTREIAVSLRIICATCLDLDEKIAKEEFRRDLFYRIAMLPLVIPPLRERERDVLEILQSFIQHYSLSFGRPALSVTPEVEELFLDYGWPGNCRELKNLVERVFILKESSDHRLRLCDLPEEMLDSLPEKQTRPVSPAGEGLQEQMETFEKQLIGHALKKAGHNRTKAAEILAISRFALLRRMQKYEME